MKATSNEAKAPSLSLAAGSSSSLSDAQIVALGSAVKPKALTDAKGRLPDMANEPVDFRVRIRGTVTKGVGTPASSGKSPATCDLFNRSMITEVMRLLKIKPEKLRASLREAAAHNGHAHNYADHPANAALLTVVNEVSQEIAATLPATTYSSNGRAATVSSNLTFELV